MSKICITFEYTVMTTLNQIADSIADRLNKPFDYAFKARIKFAVKYWRARLIRQDIQKFGNGNTGYQTINVCLESVDSLGHPLVSSNCKVQRSKYKLPEAIRNDSFRGYAYCASLDGKITFSYATAEEMPYKLSLKYASKLPYYEIINGYLWVYNLKRIKYIRVKDMFADPSAVNDSNCTEEGELVECYNDDMDFPIPLDLIPIIVDGIVRGELNIVQQDKEVDIQPEQNDGD